MSKLEEQLGLLDYDPCEAIWDDPSAHNLKKIPKAKQTPEMVRFACKNDGLALEYASKKLIDYDLCEVAVRQNGCALNYVPDKYFAEDNKEFIETLCELAVSNNGFALRYVPENYKTKEIVERAVKTGAGSFGDYWGNPPIAYVPRALLTKELLALSIATTPRSLESIPKNRVTKTLAKQAVVSDGLALQFVPNRIIDKEIVSMALANNVMAIQYVPESLIDQAICDRCFQENCATLSYFPEEYITESMCVESIKKCFSVTRIGRAEVVCFSDFPERIRNEQRVIDAIVGASSSNASQLLVWNERVIEDINEDGSVTNRRGDTIKPLKKSTVAYLKRIKNSVNTNNNEFNSKAKTLFPEENLLKYGEKARLPLPEVDEEALVVINENGISHCISEESASTTRVYYITDIHLEHQLLDWAQSIAAKKPAQRRGCLLLIGGDVADSVDLSELFYELLLLHWEGPVISILGNHELWDGKTELIRSNSACQLRPVDTIVKDYKRVISNPLPVPQIMFSAKIIIMNDDIEFTITFVNFSGSL